MTKKFNKTLVFLMCLAILSYVTTVFASDFKDTQRKAKAGHGNQF